MIDREALRTAYKTTVMSCIAVMFAPVLLMGLGWFMWSDPRPGGPGSGTLNDIRLVIYGVVALSPLVTLPVVRMAWRLRPISSVLDGPGLHLREAEFMRRAIVEFALWEISSLMGFVAFFLGATWTYFLAAVLFTYIGFFATFPRWSRWSRIADEVDAELALTVMTGGDLTPSN